MYLKRKIDKILLDWWNKPHHSPTLVSGVRQCGKTTSILQFASKHFAHVIYINFWKTPKIKECFEASLEVDNIIKLLSFFDASFSFVPFKTIIILDEIQDCPNARLSLKFFKEDGRFEIIASGSYIGLNILENDAPVPMPNGAEDIIYMKTMDFEEFLWAHGYGEETISHLENYFEKKETIPSSIHEKMKQLFKEYMCVGGYPEVVLDYVSSHNFSSAFNKINSLIFDIKGDPIKRTNEEGKSLYNPSEIMRIQNAFDLIVSSSFKDNQRFVISKISHGNGMANKDAVNYLVNANVAFKVHNVANVSLPLIVSKIESNFRLYYSDISIFMAMCGFDTIKALMQDSLGINKGQIYEAALADSLYKAFIPTYYFRKSSGLEIDFVISYLGYSTLIEAKAKKGNAKSSKTIMNNKEHYGVTKLIKFGDYNITQQNDILTLPYYLAFLLNRTKV